MIVMKFGGSSLESAEAIARVAGIVAARKHRHPVVVVSAMGKTTNRLLAMAEEAAKGDRDVALASCEALERYHLEEGGAHPEIERHFSELAEILYGLASLGELTPHAIDEISSFGE